MPFDPTEKKYIKDDCRISKNFFLFTGPALQIIVLFLNSSHFRRSKIKVKNKQFIRPKDRPWAAKYYIFYILSESAGAFGIGGTLGF